MVVSLVHDFSMRPFGMFGTFWEMYVYTWLVLLLLSWTAFLGPLQTSWQVLLLLLPSGLFLFGVVIYGKFISDGVFVETGELFEGWRGGWENFSQCFMWRVNACSCINKSEFDLEWIALKWCCSFCLMPLMYSFYTNHVELQRFNTLSRKPGSFGKHA